MSMYRYMYVYQIKDATVYYQIQIYCISANGEVIKMYHGNSLSLVMCMYLPVRRISGTVKYLNT